MKNIQLRHLFIIALLTLGAAFAGVIIAYSAGGSIAAVPGTITHQGYLVDSGAPVSGTVDLQFGLYSVSSGGSPLWSETHDNVAVTGGYYTVLLGSVSPLDAADFSGAPRYLQTSVDTGGGFVDLPRQEISSVPYAFQAASAPWDGLSGVPAGFADGIDDVGGIAYENYVTVSPSGGDYTSIAAALNSIASASSSNRYLVWVGPGVYTETELVSVPSYVHLKGAGQSVTLIQSTRSFSTPSNTAASVELLEGAQISDLTVYNSGTADTYGIGIYSTQTGRDTLIERVVVEANGAGGTGHYALYLNDSELTVRDSILRASGATGFGTAVNAAIGVVNIAGGFPQPVIQGSLLTGGNNDPNGKSCAGNTGTGFAIQGTNAAPLVRDSYLCGDRRSVYIGINGQAHFHHSELWVSSTGGSYLVETSSAGTVLITHSGVFYVGNKYTGTGNLVCTYNHLANYVPASDGTTPGTACN